MPAAQTALSCSCPTMQHRLRHHAHAPPVRVIINPDGSGAALCSHYAAQTARHGLPSAAPTATTIALAREVKFKFSSFSWRTCIFAFLAALRAPIEVFPRTRDASTIFAMRTRILLVFRNLSFFLKGNTCSYPFSGLF